MPPALIASANRSYATPRSLFPPPTTIFAVPRRTWHTIEIRSCSPSSTTPASTGTQASAPVLDRLHRRVAGEHLADFETASPSASKMHSKIWVNWNCTESAILTLYFRMAPQDILGRYTVWATRGGKREVSQRCA